MKIYWVISKDIEKNVLDPEFISDIAPSWGSYLTWKEYQTDNCVCNEVPTINELVNRSFNTLCHLWVPERFFIEIGRPEGLHQFGGEFTNNDYSYKDDIVALHLASGGTDILLLLGFDLSPVKDDDVLRTDYLKNISQFIKSHPDIQFVLVNYDKELSEIVDNIPNLSTDTAESVKELLC